MRRILIIVCLIPAAVAAAGCSTMDDGEWTPWCDFRGYCQLMLTVNVTSEPNEAEVYVGNELKGTTPCTVVLEALPAIIGQKCIMPSPADGKDKCMVRNTRFNERTAYTIRVVKKGFEPLSKSIVMEEVFPSNALRHDMKYEKTVTMIFSL